MAVQPPFRADAFQVENSDSPVGPRLLESRLSDGSLMFTDPRIPAGISLYELAGLQRGHNIIIVSQTGEAASKAPDGTLVTTIQKAFDQIPDSSDANNPWIILVLPGVYFENLVVVKDHVTVVALGEVVLKAPANQDTVRIVEGVFTAPQRVIFRGLRIENNWVNRCCVNISTAQFASGTVTFASQPNVGDIVTVAGTPLAAVANGTVPAAGQFQLGTTTAETAANLVLALQDPLNGLTAVVFPSSAANVTTIRAAEPGIAGNVLTIASSVNLVMVVSGPTLTGGLDSSNGSMIGFDSIEFDSCDFVFQAVTGWTLKAQAVNHIRVLDGDWSKSSLGSIVEVRECASLLMRKVGNPWGMELHYDSLATNLPFDGTSSYRLEGISSLSLSSDLSNVGTLIIWNSEIGTTTFAGTQIFDVNFSHVGDLAVFDTAQTTLSNTTRTSLVGSATAFCRETSSSFSTTFVAESVKTVTFAVPQPDADYIVVIEPLQDYAYVLNKAVSGFDVAFTAPQNATVVGQVLRSM